MTCYRDYIPQCTISEEDQIPPIIPEYYKSISIKDRKEKRQQIVEELREKLSFIFKCR